MNPIVALITMKALVLNRFTCVASVLATVLFIGAEFGAANGREQPVSISSRQYPSDTLPENAVQKSPVFVHRRLMHVTLTKSKRAVLRYVECRHYPKEHQKLVQIGLSPDGNPLLRMLPGDYCEFVANSAAKTAEIGAPEAESQEPRSLPNAGLSPGEWDHLTQLQRYTCEKFGEACRIALAVQQAENTAGACEIYHYNSADGTLDWGYFQINTVHLTRPGLVLRDLLDCKKNIDFAYLLYREKGFTPWVTYVTGAYRRFLPNNPRRRLLQPEVAQLPSVRGLVPIY